jgi:hypothetical protein
MTITRNAQLMIAAFLLATPTSGYAKNKIQLAPLFPIKLSTEVDASAKLSGGGKIALMDVTVAATLADVRTKLMALIPQINEQIACAGGGGGFGGKIANIGVDLPGNLHQLRVTIEAQGQRCGIGLPAAMTVSTTLDALVTGNKSIELRAETPQVSCNNLVCTAFRQDIINAIAPKINDSASMVGAWIDRQIKQPMEKYQQPPYNLKIVSVNINPARTAHDLTPGDLGNLIVQIVLSGQAPVDDLDEFASNSLSAQ